MTKWINEQTKLVKIILFFPIWGWAFSGLYRIFKYIEGNKNVVTLVVGLLALFIPFIGFVVSIIDLLTVIIDNKVEVLAD
jgi:uncharacterized membrane protein YjjP (DUF1212 family)